MSVVSGLENGSAREAKVVGVWNPLATPSWVPTERQSVAAQPHQLLDFAKDYLVSKARCPAVTGEGCQWNIIMQPPLDLESP